MSTFTPEQIQEILDLYFENFAHRQYIGARYVPIFGRKDEESIVWDNTGTYEPLTVVLYQGNSYTSRQFVPIGVEITNETYWAETGNYNAQVEQYRQEVLRYEEAVQDLSETVEDVVSDLADEIEARSNADDDLESAISDEADARENADTQIRDDFTALFNNLPLTDESVFEIEVGKDDTTNAVYTILKFAKDDVDFSYAYRYTDYPSIDISEYVEKYCDEAYAFNGPLRGVFLVNNVAIVESSAATNQYFYILGFDQNGDIKYTQDFTRELTCTNLMGLGYKSAFGIWSPIIIDSVPFDTTTLPTTDPNVDTVNLINLKHTRTVFGFDNQDNYYAVFIEGRLSASQGMSYSDMCTFLVSKGITTAFNLDGGGSTQLWTCGECNMNFVFPDSSEKTAFKNTRPVVALIKVAGKEIQNG